jgi:prophage regulatory protein
LLLASEVMELVRLRRSELYRQLGLGRFPPPVRLGERRVAWRQSDVERWMAERRRPEQLLRDGAP